MEDYLLMTDSCCDLPDSVACKLGLSVMPLTVSLQGKSYRTYLDQRELSTAGFYQVLRKGESAHTSAPLAAEFYQRMEKALLDGKDVFYIGFSSALSLTFQNAKSAAGALKEKYPQRKILCLDSKSASLGQGLLVYLAAREKEKGASFEELEQYVRGLIPRVCHWFTVDDTFFLKRGGRNLSTSSIAGTRLHIKPVLYMDQEGNLIGAGKVRGRKAAVDTLLSKISQAPDIQKQAVFISHGDCPEEAEYLAQQIRDNFSPREILVNPVGPVIGAHSGPGTLALFFLGEKR